MFLPHITRPQPTTSKVALPATHSQQHQFSRITSDTLNPPIHTKVMAKLTKPAASHARLASRSTPGHFSTDSTASNRTTLYETASEGQTPDFYETNSEPQLPKLDGQSEPHPQPKPKPHVSRNKMVRNDFGVHVPPPLETGRSEHGPWVPPKPIVEDNNSCCCTIL